MGDSDLLSTVRADVAANDGSSKGKVVVAAFRLVQNATGTGAAPLWAVPLRLAYRVVVDWIMGIDLPSTVTAGPGLGLFHGTGLVVHGDVRLGAGVTLRQGVTIGALGEGTDGIPPVLGDRVSVGAGAIILGPLRIGDDVTIGAGAVVLNDVPDGATVVGNPGRIVGRTTESSD